MDDVINQTSVPFSKGFNLFAYPFSIPAELNTCTSLIAQLGTPEEILSIERFNRNTQRYEKCNHIGGNDFDIFSDEGIIVNSTVSKIVVINGITTCPAIDISSGMNLIGFVSANSLSCFKVLDKLAESSLQHFNEQSGRYETCVNDNSPGNTIIEGIDFKIIPGKGYLLHSISEFNQFSPGC